MGECLERNVRRIAVAACLVLAGPALADPTPTRDYVVQPGDSCVAIAERELGDRALYPKIHELNPGMGPLPHNLTPGTILKLPGASGAASPDATLTAAHGGVGYRSPELTEWRPAVPGLALFRAWSVRSRDRSTAELTFRDRSQLAMRENTIVIIFGPTAPRAQVSHGEAVLESGGLESRLDAASRPSLVVRTPSSEALLAGGHALVTVDRAGASVVANHGGAAVAVRGTDTRRQATGSSVAVAEGMGTRVEPKRPPTPPRKLPPPPGWPTGADRFVDLAGAGATVTLRWAPVAVAVDYRVELLSAGIELTAVEVPAAVTSLELHHLAPGDYIAHVSTIDADRFESLRSADRAFHVVAAAVFPPGATAALVPPAAPAPSDAGPDLTAAVPRPRFATGSRIVAPAGMTCGVVGGARASELTLPAPGDVALECATADGAVAATLAATVVPLRVTGAPAGPTPVIARRTPTRVIVTIAGDAAFGTAMTVRTSEELTVLSTTPGDGTLEVVVLSTGRGGDRGRLTVAAGTTELGSLDLAIEPRAQLASAVASTTRGPRLEIGAYAGYHMYRTGERAGAALGGAVDPAAVIGPGPALGLHLGSWLLPRLGVEVEAGIVAGSWANVAGHSLIATVRTHGTLTLLERSRVGLHLVVGGGADLLVRTIPGTRRDTAAVFDGGLRLTVGDGHGLRWWLEARDDLEPSRDAAASSVLDVRAGFLREF